MFEEQIADGMPQRIVDEFKAIQIDKQNGEMGPITFRMRQRGGEPVIEEDTIGETGQTIVIREAMDGTFRLLSFRDVLSGADHHELMRLFIAHAFPLEMNGEIDAVPQDYAMIHVARPVMVRDIAEGLFDGCPVVRVNQGKKILDGSSEILRSYADEPAKFIGHGEAIRSRFPVPIADARDPLRQLEPCLALASAPPGRSSHGAYNGHGGGESSG